ncbi:angiogenic factor with G patch and FHA domains 1 isoform X1 [Malaclemys terrapin pileata]|uniref:angiogenic factor with G patch and FHA domains 1 isoform X1 n=1 Tax=Malaclemys terrapin pileata TaxID=2991368 RepID=UPI0023A7D049|nr:angiogenic factor with G patch and FHA domains 1 isoform X1 [Malaclemys terrapin pileata]
MASPPLPEPGAELRALQGKVEVLEAELGSCRSQLEQVQRLLRHTERLYREAQESNEALQTQVEELSKEVHDRKKRERDTSSVEVQTEDYDSWQQSDYYNYQNYCNNIDAQDNTSELSVQQNHESEDPNPNSTEQSQAGGDIHSHIGSTELAECGQGDNLIENLQEPEDTSLAEGTLAESLRAAAEAAVSQTGFIYDENTGLYYDHSTGFYYNSENQLYYDPTTGIYYYCDVESGRYQFHSRVDLQSYQASTTQTKDKKGKKKRKDPEWITANEYKDLDKEEQKSPRNLNCLSTTNEQISSTEEEESPNARKKAKVDIDVRNRLTAKESIITDGINSHLNRKIQDTAAFMDDSKIIETESEPEEGEITDSECEEYSTEDEVTSEESVNSEDSENEDEERIWPPCIRVIVIRSPVLQTGSLYIITAVKAATIGREKDMQHTLQIPEVGVSKFHAEVYFDHELQNYVLVDQGSQNGTVVNGNQILQPKTKCDPYVLEHGDEVKIGETVLSFHIHPGSDTCDGCEPGQVRAHLRLDKKKEFSGPALSKEERELVRRKALKKIRVKYGLQNTDYEDNKAVKNPNYKDRAGKRRETIGSEGTFQRDDTPASVHVEISDSNKGRKMLEKMGWKKGEGLGKDGGGMKNPIQLQIHKMHAGLGTSRPASVEDVQIIKSKNKKNWDKARERFAESFQEAKTQKDAPKVMPWVRGTAE